MKVGVFIACAAWHERYLPSLVQNLVNGSPPPDRIAIVFSGGVPSSATVDSTRGCYLACFDEIVPCGDAKNMADAMLKECDVIAYHDADDLMTKDRIAVIRGEFSNGSVMAMNHSYSFRGNEPMRGGRVVVSTDYPYASLDDGLTQPAFGKFCDFKVHAGAVCVRRDVLRVVKWKSSMVKAEDLEFCTKLLYVLGKRHLITNDRIYVYHKPELESALFA